MAGEISIVAKDGSAAYDQMRYGDLNIELLVADPDRLELNISSEKEQGKVIIINIDPDSVPSLENLTVFMDGTVVRQVDDPLQVLYASGSSMNDAVYSIVHDDDHVNLIIYIPHFSSHSLVISGAAAIMDEVAGPMGILVAVSAIALVGFAATALFRRKK
jgi:hypothetical protein